MDERAIIIGAGPAGLTAAYELLEKTNIIPIIFESTSDIGGISKTINYKENRIDIGGHRFFSKSEKVMNWWLNILPLEDTLIPLTRISDTHSSCRNSSLSPKRRGVARSIISDETDDIMLLRPRLSRILFLRKFFDYPVSLSWNTISNLGFTRMSKIGFSYIKSVLFQRNENSLEDFFINRFGYELYSIFFKDYTQKVWGVPCSEIKPEWGIQRVKGLSVAKAILKAIKKPFIKSSTKFNLTQKNQETSLIEQFMYPKFGPGQMWEKVADIVKSKGGEIYLNQNVVGINTNNNKITSVMVQNTQTGEIKEHFADYVISSMPVKDLITSIEESVPQDVQSIATGLKYRDFITVGILLNKLKIGSISDNWIYVQEKDVKLGRIQVFNNWSPYLVKNPEHIWLGLEYFCNEGVNDLTTAKGSSPDSHSGEHLWNMTDDEFSAFAVEELAKIGFINQEDVLDSVVIRMPKAYPAYFGTYDKFNVIKDFLNQFENLFLIGRNGMHRYNNMDHSMLSAMQVVENIINKVKTKDNIWNINADEEYHESE